MAAGFTVRGDRRGGASTLSTFRRFVRGGMFFVAASVSASAARRLVPAVMDGGGLYLLYCSRSP